MPGHAARAASPPVLSTANVTLERNGRPFARLPDLSLDPETSVALLGPSGSGKTTALLALAGLRRPAAGRIAIQDHDLWEGAQAARDRFRGRHIGLVFQTFHLVDALDVETNLRLAARCADRKPEAGWIAELLERLGLAPLRGQRADRLSQGEAQRVAVARALVNRPALVLADEPTSALDDDNTMALASLLQDCVRRIGAALLIATHDQRLRNRLHGNVTMERIQ